MYLKGVMKKMKKARNRFVTLIFMLIITFVPIEVFGDSGYYTVYDIKTEKVLFRTAMEVHEKDIYLSERCHGIHLFKSWSR